MDYFPWWVIELALGVALVIEAGVISLRLKKRALSKHLITDRTMLGAIFCLLLFTGGSAAFLPTMFFLGTMPGYEMYSSHAVIAISVWAVYAICLMLHLRWIDTPYVHSGPQDGWSLRSSSRKSSRPSK